MIPLKTGPYLALDASSVGDSYFVKIKLKSICNVPAVCRSQGWARRGPCPGPDTALGTQKWMVASGMGCMFSRLGVRFGTRRGPLEGLVLEEGRG